LGPYDPESTASPKPHTRPQRGTSLELLRTTSTGSGPGLQMCSLPWSESPAASPPSPPFRAVPSRVSFLLHPPATSTPAGTCVLSSSSSSSPSSPHLLLVPSAPCRTQPIGSPLLPPITYLFLRRIHRSPFRHSLLVPPPLGIGGCYRVVIGSPGFVASNLCLCQPRAATIFSFDSRMAHPPVHIPTNFLSSTQPSFPSSGTRVRGWLS
jgi:hypothetical protein